MVEGLPVATTGIFVTVIFPCNKTSAICGTSESNNQVFENICGMNACLILEAGLLVEPTKM